MAAGFSAYGKMPAVGDFFHLNPPPGFVRVWDDWVQAVLLTGQGVHGPYWDGYYMSAPIWRFTLTPGLAGPEKVMGVLMPSVDRVGRRFPLTLLAALPTPGPAALDHLCEMPLFERLEDLALASLEDGMTKERLAEALADHKVPSQRAHVPLLSGAGQMIVTGVQGTGLLPELLAAEMIDHHVPRASLWTADLDGTTRTLVCDGLPTGASALGLFDLTAPIWNEAKPL